MALNTGELSAADIAAVTGNDNNNGWGGDGAWWIIILFLFAFAGGWGNNGGGCGYGGYGAEVQRGFDQSAVMNSLGDVGTAINTGFSNMAVAQCNGQTTLLQAINALAMGNQIGFSNNTAAIADLKYTVATENCQDRATFQQGIQTVITNQNAGIQSILDKMCQQELDAERRTNDQLRTQLNLANLAASQNAQTAAIIANNEAQTAALENYLNPPARPAYLVQNPNCCQQFSGCGCGCGYNNF